jgi:hypothetical protein
MRRQASRLIARSLTLAGVAWNAGCATTSRAGDATAAKATTDCRLCSKEVPAGQGVVANVALPGHAGAAGGERRIYRCIYCALTDLRDVPQPFTLEATSPMSQRKILLSRKQGEWTAQPSSAVYLILPEHAEECLDVHQPFASRDEFDAYVAAHPEIASQNPQPYTINQYEQMLEAGLPIPGADDGLNETNR